MLQEAVLHHVGGLGHADALAEIADGFGGVAPAAEAAEGGHPGVVPAGDPALLHQAAELALAHDRVVDSQAGELDLPGLCGQVAVLHHPVVQRPVGLKFQGTEGVGDALQSVLDGVGEVVHGVDAPRIPVAVVGQVVNPVEHRVPHVEVAAVQVDLGPEGHGPVGELSTPHPAEKVQAFLYGPVPVGTPGGDAHAAPVLLELLRAELTDVGQAFFDEALRLAVVLLKVVGAEEEAVPPVKAQPVDVLLDGLHKLLVLLGGVRVVHAEVAQPAVFLGGAEVDGQGLAVADVEIAVGLRRKAGVDRHALELPAGGHVFLNERVNEIPAFQLRRFDFVRHSEVLPM